MVQMCISISIRDAVSWRMHARKTPDKNKGKKFIEENGKKRKELRNEEFFFCFSYTIVYINNFFMNARYSRTQMPEGKLDFFFVFVAVSILFLENTHVF